MEYCSNIRIMFSKHFNEIGTVIWSDWHPYPQWKQSLDTLGKSDLPNLSRINFPTSSDVNLATPIWGD